MNEYDDKSYYEVQLEQKQLVLILLLVVGICVLFFFLGVYYEKGRTPEAALASQARKEAEPLKAPESPDKVDTEQASTFFEKGGSREGAAKADYEGGKVVAESTPVDPKSARDRKPSPDDDKAGAMEAPPAKAAPDRPRRKQEEEPRAAAAPPRASPERPTEAASKGEGFNVQIAAMKDGDRASKVVGDLKAKGFPAHIEEQDRAGAKFYKIRVGPYREKDKADQAMNGLRSIGYDGAFVSTD